MCGEDSCCQQVSAVVAGPGTSAWGRVEAQGRGYAQEWCLQVVGVLSLGCCAVENMSLHCRPLVWPMTL